MTTEMIQKPQDNRLRKNDRQRPKDIFSLLRVRLRNAKAIVKRLPWRKQEYSVKTNKPLN